MKAKCEGWVFHANNPNIEIEETFKGEYQLVIGTTNGGINLTLSRQSLQSLAVQCEPHLPDPPAKIKKASSGELFRECASAIKYLDDQAICVLLRNIEHQILINFLWYMKDANLIARILDNLSSRAAAMIMDDLNHQWKGKDPDNIAEPYARLGREAINEVVSLYQELVGSGELIDLLGGSHDD